MYINCFTQAYFGTKISISNAWNINPVQRGIRNITPTLGAIYFLNCEPKEKKWHAVAGRPLRWAPKTHNTKKKKKKHSNPSQHQRLSNLIYNKMVDRIRYNLTSSLRHEGTNLKAFPLTSANKSTNSTSTNKRVLIVQVLIREYKY